MKSEESGIKFSVCHIGIVTKNPEATSLHLRRHFGFESQYEDSGISRHILKKDGVLLEVNNGTPPGGQHLAMKFQDESQAFNYFMLLPEEIVCNRAVVVTKSRPKKLKVKKPSGLISFEIVNGLRMEFVWGDPIKAHDS